MVIITHEAESVADYVTDFVELSDGKMYVHDIEEYRAELKHRAELVDYETASAPAIPNYKDLPNAVATKDAFVRYSKNARFVLRGAAADVAHAIGTVVVLLVLYAPWWRKLERIKRKYALL